MTQRRTVLGLVAIASAVVLAMVWASLAFADPGDDRAVVAEWSAAALARDTPRPRQGTPAGDPEARSAEAAYAVALAELARHAPQLNWSLSENFASEDMREPLAAERAAALRAALQPAVAALREAARGRLTDAPARHPSRAAYAALRLELDAIDPRRDGAAFASLWLDTARVVVDQLPEDVNGHWYRCLPSLFAAVPAARLQDLDPTTLAELAEGLQRLEPDLARSPDPALPVAAWAAGLANGSMRINGERLGYRLWAWRHGGDVERASLAEIRQILPAIATLQPPTASGTARDAQLTALRRATAGMHSWLVYSCVDEVIDQDGHQRTALAELRLRRLAVAFLRREALPELADPFADGPLVVESDGDRATCHSAGAAGPAPFVVTRAAAATGR